MGMSVEHLSAEISSLNGRFASLEAIVYAQEVEVQGEASAMTVGSDIVRPPVPFALISQDYSVTGGSSPSMNHWRITTGSVFFSEDVITEDPSIHASSVTSAAGYYVFNFTDPAPASRYYLWLYLDTAQEKWCLVKTTDSWTADADWGTTGFFYVPLMEVPWASGTVTLESIEMHWVGGDIHIGAGSSIPDSSVVGADVFSLEMRSDVGHTDELSIYGFEDRTSAAADDALALYVGVSGGNPSITYRFPAMLESSPRNAAAGGAASATVMDSPVGGTGIAGGLDISFNTRDFEVDNATVNITAENGGSGGGSSTSGSWALDGGSLDGAHLIISNWPGGTIPHADLNYIGGDPSSTNKDTNTDHSYRYLTLGGAYNGDPDGCWAQSIGRGSNVGPTSAQTLAVDLLNSNLYDGTEVISVGFDARTLIYSDGATISVDWGTSRLRNAAAGITLDWNAREINTTAGDWTVTAPNSFLIANVAAASALDTGGLQMQGGFSFKKRAYGSDGTYEIALVDTSGGRSLYATDGAQTAALCNGSQAAVFTSAIGQLTIGDATYVLDAQVGDLNVEAGGYFIGSLPGATVGNIATKGLVIGGTSLVIQDVLVGGVLRDIEIVGIIQ